MANNQILSAQQNDLSELQAAVQHALTSSKYDDEKMLPAIVQSYDRTTNIATVKPLIAIVRVNGTAQSRHPLTNINVLSLGGGGFHMSFPLKAGSLGWIIAGDRDLALFKQSLEESTPSNSRYGTFADGLFVPDVFRQYSIADEDEDALLIQAVDGSCKISLQDGFIKILHPTKIILSTPLVECSEDFQVGNNLTVLGNTATTGTTSANGGLSAEGTTTLPSDTSIGGIDVLSHGHEQQNNGSGRTAGGMIS